MFSVYAILFQVDATQDHTALKL